MSVTPLLSARAFADQLHPHLPPNVGLHLWDGVEIPAQHDGCRIHVPDSSTAMQMLFASDSRILAELFVNGSVRVDGDLEAAVGIIDKLADVRARLPGGPPPSPSDAHSANGFAPAQLNGARDSRERVRTAISYHYDKPPEFWKLWLDPYLQYTCGYFAGPDDTLEAAQERKLQLIGAKLDLRSGERLLDLGCGWGGWLCFAARRFGILGHGITLSEAQLAYAKSQFAELGLANCLSAEIRDFRDLPSEGGFDKASGVGIMEHAGRALADDYFAAAARNLKPGGLFLSQAIAWTQPPEANRIDPFLDAYIFPDGELLTIGEASTAAERAGFEVLDVEGMREHYVLTARAWLRRLEAQELAVSRIVGADGFRVFRLYLAGFVHRFSTGAIGVYQLLLRKRAAGPPSPVSRTSWYPTDR